MNKPIDITNITLTTDRLILRPWRESDLEDLYAYAKVDGVGQMAGWMPHESIETSQIVLESFIRNKKTFAIAYDGKVIGSLGIEAYKEENYPELAPLQGREIGYVLSKDYWGQGLMPEAVNAVVAYLLEEENLDFILVGHFTWNRQSARVIEKCGFEYVKTVDYTTQFGKAERSREYILYNTKHNSGTFRKDYVDTMIRGVTAEDLPECLTVIHDSFRTVAEEFGLTPENCPKHTSFLPLTFLETQMKWGWHMFALYAGKRIIGYMSLSKSSECEYELHNLAVLPAYRHSGFGRQLLDHAKETVKALGGTAIKIGIIEESTVLKNWYIANGFVHTGAKKFDHLPFTSGYLEWKRKE